MATPLSADRLLAALRAEGVRVVEYRSWRTHNRNSAGPWGPVNGVMIHHTVTSGTDASVKLCYNGRSDLPGPLCHGVIAKDGTVHLVGHGRANHAGKGDGDVLAAVIAERALPRVDEADTDGNTRFYGFECVNLGDNRDPWPAAQVEAIVRASAAICRAHGWGKAGDTSVIGHLEWQPGKIDPRGPGISMPDIRRRVAERLKHPASWSPNTTPEEDDVALTAAEIDKIAERVWRRDFLTAAPEAKAKGNPDVTAETWLTYLGARLREVIATQGAQGAVLARLAEGGGLTAAEIQAAAEAGARAALAELGDALGGVSDR
ncbi:N-acetylmuramoyl-L-alanine amidase [Streptomyces hoynatensis]|uniref:N-acetylmuramoyl-L-alanine amidase n=1 Tax=Streptomyces hoynatensis TaxID=1141874 RepID=UPI0015750AD9|nr:peptidoglycan recognition family protein [Streptomyces hoynatensis]